MKPRIKIIDTYFSHGKGLGVGDLDIKPTYFEYYRGNDQIGDIVLITDSSFHKVDECKETIKIGWITEPLCINPKIYHDIQNPELYNKFSFILTHNKELIEFNDKFRFFPYGGSWIYPKDWQIYPKSKDVSIIVSHKNATIGQKLRHEIVKKFGDKIDVFGNAYKFVEYKLEALKDYRYSIVVENERRETWFSEKLIDCFATGTIPIYFGAEDIYKFFWDYGLIEFRSISAFEYIINNVSFEALYSEKSKEISRNFKTARQFAIPEDWIWNNYLKNYF